MTKMTFRGLPFLAAGSMLIAFLAGCGGADMGTVKGKASVQGQPVKGWTLQLESPKTGTGASAFIADDGGFAIAEPLAVGTYAACFVAPLPEPPAPGAAKKAPAVGSKLPMKYLSKSSGLTVEVKPGVNDVVLDLIP